MKRILMLISLAAIIALTGCETAEQWNTWRNNPLDWPPITVLGAHGNSGKILTPTNAAIETSAAPEPPRTYAVLYETNDYTPALYEPHEGCYIGAAITAENRTALSEFERRTKKEHAVFSYEMRLGDAFPETWLLSCIANRSTPLLLIHPTGDSAIFDSVELKSLAAAIGAYNIPVFVAFFPVTPETTYDTTSYKLYFRYARVIFAENAPQAAFVWTADLQTPDADNWYPGHDATDWVGLIATETSTELMNITASDTNLAESTLAASEPIPSHESSKSDETYTPDLINAIDAFYQKYQKEKPVMLTRLGVSHFSTQDCVYRTREAAVEIESIYRIIEAYPRIKLVCYQSMTQQPGEDFSITQEDLLLTAYRENVSRRYYLSALETDHDAQSIRLRSSLPGYYTDGQLYISAATVTKELKLPEPAEIVDIAGQRCVNTHAIPSGDLFINANHEYQWIQIYQKIN